MRRTKPVRASLERVCITRGGGLAIIENANATKSTNSLNNRQWHRINGSSLTACLVRRNREQSDTDRIEPVESIEDLNFSARKH